MTHYTEFTDKLARMRALLDAHHLDVLLLQRVSSFAWATCGGASYINTADSHGIAALLVTPHDHYLITNNIEAERLEQEEELGEQNWRLRVAPWHEAQNAIAELTQARKFGADGPYAGAVDLSHEVSRLRAALTPAEGERYRTLGALCAKAMDAAIRAVRPGQSEYQIAAQLDEATQSRGVQVTVNLIATDERIFNFRHPLPSGKKLERYAMLVLCGRKYGLVCSITRLIHFGPLAADLRRKVDAVAQIDAAMISATRQGRSLGEIFTHATSVYARTGFADEWMLHHQGGLAGYEPREVIATPDSTDVVSIGQVFAWNPSVTGTKSEDTILVGEDDNEILTAIAGWPMLSIEVDGQTIERPAILEVK